MLAEDSEVRKRLRQMTARFSGEASHWEDLMQECLLNLCKVEREKPGHTLSWYVQSCRFHLQHCLSLGRSLDSPKRCLEQKRLTIELSEEEHFPEALHTNGE